MNLYYITNSLIIGSLLLSVLSGAKRYEAMDTGLKFFWLLNCASLVGESAGFYAAIKYGNNLGVYGSLSIVSIFVICLYFNYSVSIFRKYNAGIFIGTVSVVIGIFNNFFLQSSGNFPSYFMHYQALLIIGMTMFALRSILQKQNFFDIKKSSHFWIYITLLFFYITTYFNWTLFEYHAERTKHENRTLLLSMFLSNFVTNIATALIFYFTRKMPKHAT